MQALEALTRDAKALANGEIVLSAPEAEVARQLQICNACRYCEGFCAVFPGVKADTLPELAQKLGLPVDTFTRTLDAYNAACRVGQFDHTTLDDCHTEGVAPAKTHWARPIDTGPFYGYALKPGVTFTYLGLHTDDTAAVRFNNQPSPNLFVAGEMMAGNVLGKGYTAGVGMSIGTAFGRIAGTQAALASKRPVAPVEHASNATKQGANHANA